MAIGDIALGAGKNILDLVRSPDPPPRPDLWHRDRTTDKYKKINNMRFDFCIKISSFICLYIVNIGLFVRKIHGKNGNGKLGNRLPQTQSDGLVAVFYVRQLC